MKFAIERGTLLKAVAQAQSVVERRNTIPILANVLIEAEGNDISFLDFVTLSGNQLPKNQGVLD